MNHPATLRTNFKDDVADDPIRLLEVYREFDGLIDRLNGLRFLIGWAMRRLDRDDGDRLQVLARLDQLRAEYRDTRSSLRRVRHEALRLMDAA